jgi:hypothetical protein
MATGTNGPVRRSGSLVLAGGLLFLLGACAAVKPMAYTEIHEIPPGPGLLSGEDGEFVLYGD